MEQLTMKNIIEDQELVKQEAGLRYLQGLASRVRIVRGENRLITKSITRLPDVRAVDDEVTQIMSALEIKQSEEPRNQATYDGLSDDEELIGRYDMAIEDVHGARKLSECESFDNTEISFKDSCSSPSSNFSGGIHHLKSNKSSSLLKLFSCSLQTEEGREASQSSKVEFNS